MPTEVVDLCEHVTAFIVIASSNLGATSIPPERSIFGGIDARHALLHHAGRRIGVR